MLNGGTELLYVRVVGSGVGPGGIVRGEEQDRLGFVPQAIRGYIYRA